MKVAGICAAKRGIMRHGMRKHGVRHGLLALTLALCMALALGAMGALAGCASSEQAATSDEPAGAAETEQPAEDSAEEGEAMSVTATLNGRDFQIELADNDTAAAFAQMLPVSGTFRELNGNEKYLYLESALPMDAYKPGRIEAGDVMLFQDNCLVVFYESHDTSYSYTRIGKVTNAADLAGALGSGDVEGTFAAR